MTRPGERLRTLATRVLDPSTIERLIDPVIADLQHEYDQANRRGRSWRRRGIRLAGYLAFWKVGLLAGARLALQDRRPGDDRAVARTVGYSFAAIAGVVAILISGPWSSSLRHLPSDKAAWTIIYLLPQALLIAIPLGLVFGILFGLRGSVLTGRVRWSVATLTLACSIATLLLAAWTMPAANQAFRELMAGRRLAERGFNEMTLRELARTPAQNIWIVSATANRLAFEFQFRLALAFASLALGPFAMAMTAAWRGTSRVLGGLLTGSLATLAYYMLLFWARQAGTAADEQASVAVAWIPNLVVLAMTLLLFRRQRTSETRESYR